MKSRCAVYARGSLNASSVAGPPQGVTSRVARAMSPIQA